MSATDFKQKARSESRFLLFPQLNYLCYFTSSCSVVRLGSQSSSPFTLQRGERQGSILSPSLFLLVMDPLLKQLQSASLGLSIHNTYAGGYLHADDIRTLACSYSSMEAQIAMVSQFASDNFLTLNKSNCEVVIISASAPKHTATTSSHVVYHSFPIQDEAKCLGYIWSRNLSAASMINERIHKARQAFFQFGSISAFQGNLSPISSSSIIKCCVYPVFLYGMENWICVRNRYPNWRSFKER